MDYLKKETIRDDSSWDLYCKYVKQDTKLAKIFRRNARHRLKNDLLQNKENETVEDNDALTSFSEAEK